MKTTPCSVGTGRRCDQARYEFRCRVGGGVGEPDCRHRCRQDCARRFAGRKMGGKWRMTDSDITAAIAGRRFAYRACPLYSSSQNASFCCVYTTSSPSE